MFAQCFQPSAGMCRSYSDLVSGSSLGAQEYTPAVYVLPENESKYNQVLATCRQAAINGQVTAAQKAQLETITGVVEGTAEGLAFGAQMANIYRSVGLDTDLGDAALTGAGIGLIGSLASSFASGTEDTAAKSRTVLLNCLRVTSQNGSLWRVLE